MPYFALAERRLEPRYPADGLVVSVRKKGRLVRMQGLAADFNRHGIALLLNQPLGKDVQVYVTLACGDTVVHNVVGIVHNCVSMQDRFRCGIQFRTASDRQVAPAETKTGLEVLEARFIALKTAPAA